LSPSWAFFPLFSLFDAQVILLVPFIARHPIRCSRCHKNTKVKGATAINIFLEKPLSQRRTRHEGTLKCMLYSPSKIPIILLPSIDDVWFLFCPVCWRAVSAPAVVATNSTIYFLFKKSSW
jgi:hypothetical protein